MASRRAVLEASTTAMAASLAGCVGGRLLGCSSSKAAVVETRPVPQTAVGQRDGDPIVVGDLPEGEHRIARIAIDEGTYRDCPVADPTIPDPIGSFAKRVAGRKGEDIYGPVHLEAENRYYAVGVRIEDQVYVSLPSGDSTTGRESG